MKLFDRFWSETCQTASQQGVQYKYFEQSATEGAARARLLWNAISHFPLAANWCALGENSCLQGAASTDTSNVNDFQYELRLFFKFNLRNRS